MTKYWLLLFIFTILIINNVFADNEQIQTHIDLFQQTTYISSHNFSQNPYIGMPSLGDTQAFPSESVLDTQNVAQKWFADGTWKDRKSVV